ncbi:MAG TPA: radical SAM protein [bacterium]|nr:radical SAM protein [bacterium]
MPASRPPIYLVSQGKERNVPPFDEPPPFGLMYVGRALRDAGFSVRIIHLHGPGDRRLQEAVNAERPLFVGFSNFICPTLKYDIALSRRLTAEKVPVVWGGIFSTCLPEVVLKSGVVDYVVAGEGERAAVTLSEAIASGAPPAGIPGVGYRRGEEIVMGPPAFQDADLDAFPFGVDMVDWEPYIYTNRAAGVRLLQIPFSRGCPFRCSFCYNAMNPDRQVWRAHGVEYIRDLISYLGRHYGVNVVFLLCDNPFGKVKEARRIIEGLRVKWMTIAHQSVINAELLEWAKSCGCLGLSFGAESGSDRTLTRLNKKTTREEIKEKARLLGEAGLRSRSSWVALTPGETVADLGDTFSLMEEIFAVNPTHGFNLNIYRAYPLTPLWEDGVKLGLREPQSLDEWGAFRPEVYPLLGYSRRQVERLKLLVSVLYPFDRGLDRRVPRWARPYLRGRLRRMSFSLPVEETLKYGSRAIRALIPGFGKR